MKEQAIARSKSQLLAWANKNYPAEMDEIGNLDESQRVRRASQLWSSSPEFRERVTSTKTVKLPEDMSVRLVQLTEEEARRILTWTTGPERSGLEPTSDEIALADKMRMVIASFEAGRTLTPDEVELIRARRRSGS